MAKKINYTSMYTLRKDGRYQGYYKDASGKRHAIYDRDPEALYRKISEKEAPKPITFREIAEIWHDKHWEEIRDGTVSCYAAPYRRAIENFHDRIAAGIEPYEISNHLIRLRDQGYSAKSIKTQRTIYKMIFEFAVADERIGREIRNNPAVIAPLPSKMPRAKVREAPEDEIVRKIRANATTAYFGLFAMFLLSTGFRRGEALAVRWEDIDFGAKTISCNFSISSRTGRATVAETKTEHSVRMIPLLPDLARVLIMPKDAKPTDFIFYGSDPQKPMPESTYNRRWMHYCKDMGFIRDDPEMRISKQKKEYIVHHYQPTLTAHCMRHGYATMLFEADVDVYTAQRLLGHANIETTLAIYTHLRERKKQESINKLESYVQKEIENN